MKRQFRDRIKRSCSLLALQCLLVMTPNNARAGNLNQSIFLVATGIGLLSTYVTTRSEQVKSARDFFNLQGEYYYGIRDTSVVSEGFAIERRLAPWFSVGLELTVQQMFAADYNAFGASFNPQFKWFLFGESRLSPFIAYTAGVHYANTVFPQGGTNFTFRLIYALGFEYKISSSQFVRLSVGHLHQSNNNLLDRNPGYNGNGVALSYVWEWDRKQTTD